MSTTESMSSGQRIPAHIHSPRSISSIVVLDIERSTSLFKWNMWTALFNLLTSFIIFALTDQGNYALVFTTYASERGNPEEWAPVVSNKGRSVVGYYSGIFLLLAALDHLLVATVLRRSYEDYLKLAQNPYRWIEYSLSASVMRVQIAQLSGVLDLHLLIAIFGLTMSTMLFGLTQEITTHHLQGQPEKKTLVPFWCGFIPHVISWAIVTSYFFQGVSTGDPPGFVWAIIFILFFCDLTFAINMFLQLKEIGKWKDYLYGEIVYLVLSLTAKQLLAWINYGGTNALNSS
ncbi:hypothetical protein PTSG_08586 [Salpingoeca rosetta]|uniref:Uncharacterized protein n=1 Tax=Salpingoeca rosetta (strain ATCC 50818 / BSB-021) TaxID=946362 RepID=F2UK40_SALR5|nr:uncharacterized protein PTSG_08586 [Salpingoeca rosetta]EGD77489.1 hypothetical protein PTSG_08586 [Salpingoeca rosetta]|eukprot:XP_004990377.1 hypothetical protein PTSG_08586 [Salpingoeca rosetta]